jgi:hypothetical protein
MQQRKEMSQKEIDANEIPLVLVRVAVFLVVSCRLLWRMLLVPTSPAHVLKDLCIKATWRGLAWLMCEWEPALTYHPFAI